jgi:hypothetical protein
LVCVTCGRMTWMLTIFQQNFSMSELRQTLKSPGSHNSIVTKSYCILCILDSDFQSLKLNSTQMHCSFIRQLQVVLKIHYSKHLPKSNAKLMAAKLTTTHT